MLRTTLAGLLAHKLRLLLTAVAIMIGVGFLAGTLVYGDTAKAAFYDDLARAARNVDVSVQPNSADFTETSHRIPLDVAADVRAVPGVSHVDGRLAERLPMLDKDGHLIANFGRIGWVISTAGDPTLAMYDVKTGAVPTRDGEIAVDSTTAEIYGYHVGDTVRVVGTDRKPASLTLVGTLDLGANKRFSGLTVAALDQADLTRLTGAKGFAEIVATGTPGESQTTLARRVDDALAGRYHIETGAQVKEGDALAAAKYVDGFLTVIFAFGLVALAVSVFVIYNTFAILVAQRTRELALLRCVGASRRQLFGTVVLESIVVGVLASLVGLAVSLVVGYGLLLGRDAVGSGVPVHSLVIAPTTVLIGVVAGTLCTMIAAIVPAVTASRVPPMAALRSPSLDAVVLPRPVRRAIISGVLAAAGTVVLYAGTQASGFAGVPVAFTGGIVLFCAVIVAGPLVVARLTAWIGWLPAKLLGAPGRLGISNALRNPKRVAATTAALMVGLALMSVFSVLLATARVQSQKELDENFSVDYVLSAVYTGEPGAQGIPIALAGELRAHPELTAVAAERNGNASVGGRRASVWAMEPGALDTALRPEITQGSVASLGTGKVALNRFFAGAIGVRIGSSITVRGRGTLDVVVGALYDDSPTADDVLLDWSDYTSLAGPGQPDQVLVKAADGVSPEASRAAVDAAVASNPLVQVSSQAEWRARLSGQLDEQLAVFSALLGMSVAIGLCGIANTLSLSVLERTRESALLRALGLSRAQLRGMLVFEALLMAVVGAVVGVGIGVVVGMTAGVGLIRQYGHGTPVVPVGRLLLYIVIAALAGAVAAVLPARRAARTNIVESMVDS